MRKIVIGYRSIKVGLSWRIARLRWCTDHYDFGARMAQVPQLLLHCHFAKQTSLDIVLTDLLTQTSRPRHVRSITSMLHCFAAATEDAHDMHFMRCPRCKPRFHILDGLG